MNHKINLQARIKRHSRILKDNLGNSLSHSYKKNMSYRVLSLVIFLLFPFYPNLTYLVYSHTNSEVEFDRWEIDESTILDSFNIDKWGNKFLIESEDSYLSIDSIVDDSVWEWNKIIEYVVADKETIGDIAKKYNISEDTIIWENNFWTGHLVEKWEKITFPPVTWVTYKVKRWDTVSTIAVKYKVDWKIISQQNALEKNIIHPWQKLVIPWGKFIKPPVVTIIAKTPVKPYIKKYPQKTPKKYTAKKYPTKKNVEKYIPSKWRYKLRWRKAFSWAPWNCTRYVATYKNVNWRWNANQWLRNARAKWHKTGNNATVGAIISFRWRGYNPRYGHVWIVMEVHKNHLIISDMNYRRKYQVTYRKIKRWDRSIRWYIYVN